MGHFGVENRANHLWLRLTVAFNVLSKQGFVQFSTAARCPDGSDRLSLTPVLIVEGSFGSRRL